jgi:putative methionine-R-sulfoxide reductase with GAF domain
VSEEPVGGRVLVVGPTGSGPDGHGGSFVRGGDAFGVDREERTGETSDSETSDSDSPPDRVCGPQEVAAGLSDRLPVDVVFRDERTAPEYLDELGPTLDGVVVLGSETGALGSPVDDGSIPAIVCEGPVVEDSGAVSADAVTVGEVTAEVRAVVREGRARSGLRDQNIRLTALNRYARDIAGCETVDAVLDRTVEAATDALAFDFCVIVVVDGDQLVPRASALPEPELPPIDVTDGIAGRTLAAGKSEIVGDIQSDPDAVVEHDDLHAVLSVPIGSEGVLQMASRDRDAFDERDREFAEILSGYTKEALARLEREAGLRAERDRLHALYTGLPVPALRVERRDDGIAVTSTNAAYESTFGTVPAGDALSDVGCTDAERESYETALCADEPMQIPVTRSSVDGSDREYTLTLVPTSPPGAADSAFGVYRTR